MKVTALYVYPIKALRAIRLDQAELGPQGIRLDRTFMLCRVADGGELQRMQLSKYPECSLFAQTIVGDNIHVRYITPAGSEAAQDQSILQVPQRPDITTLPKADVNLHNSMASAYRMGSSFDAWFSSCFGFEVALLYIGDARRPVLGTFSPKVQPTPSQSGWFSSMASSLPSLGTKPEADWLTFTDMAPYLVATEASLRNVTTRFADCEVTMSAFRPNIVVDGAPEWDEDFWTGVSINSKPALTMSKMCNRCTSLNVDYDTGRPAEGERGTVLKKLMSDRRVDKGFKYAPVFGRYAFLSDHEISIPIKVGDDVQVTGRLAERPVWDWPTSEKAERQFYKR
jgi:uncharacterized protein YcbX